MRIILKPMGVATIVLAMACLVTVIIKMSVTNTRKKLPLPVSRSSATDNTVVEFLTEAEDSYEPQGNSSIRVASIRSAHGKKGVAISANGDVVRIRFLVAKEGMYKIVLRVRAGHEKNGGQRTIYWDEDAYKTVVDGKPTLFTGDPASVSKLDPSFGGVFLGSMRGSPILLTTGKHHLDVKLVRLGTGFVDYVALEPQ